MTGIAVTGHQVGARLFSCSHHGESSQMVPGRVNVVGQRLDDGDAVPVVDCRGVSKRYQPDQPMVLEDCSLRIMPGEFYGLLGPNGAGKTTTLALLCGLQTPDRGDIRILGMVQGLQVAAIRRRISLVPQRLALYDQLTIRENLLFFGRMHGLRGEVLRERLAVCLATAGLTDYADRRVWRCSGGMQQRLHLVIGLLNQPELLLLDEPTRGVDAQSRHLIHQRLQTLNRQKTTILYTSHLLTEAEHLCNRIGILDQGRIVAQGPPKELVRRYQVADLEALYLHLTGRALRDR